ncbi:MAG TPA: precorrin-3B C(17)-methyltransferase [Fibrobacteraceae bacterium]|nr:precorrin-3B C(17)-methyltransferase [Fibrobacteraceae bacterium]
MGLGPGSVGDRTCRAVAAIQSADVVMGYRTYLRDLADLLDGKETFASSMLQEEERVVAAIDAASVGRRVALVSSGDAGVYGMAGLVLEMLERRHLQLDLEVISGVSAANSAACRLGAPLMLDYCCISLSDLLVPWGQIARRLSAVAQADLVLALYNPRSQKRRQPLEEAVRILREFRSASVPVGIVDHIGLAEETVSLTDLGHLLEQRIGMRSTVIVGNSTTRCYQGWMFTPRGYALEPPCAPSC